jgi:hypothetical protein
MEFDERYIIGFITIFIVFGGIVYLTMDNVKIRIDNDKSTFYVVNDNNRWQVAGREYNSIMDGSSKLNRRARDVTVNTTINSTLITVVRNTPYKDGILIRDTYTFDGNISDIKMFPITHQVEIYNASGKFYRYEVRDLSYSGDTYKLNDETSLSFDLNMQVDFDGGYRWAWVYKNGVLRIQYDIDSDYEVFNVRLFDPPTNLSLAGLERDISAELGSPINVTATGSGTICIDIDHHDFGVNVSCDTDRVEYFANISYFNIKVNNASETNFNLTYSSAGNQTFYLPVHSNQEVLNLTLDLLGYENSGNFPSGVKLYINDTLSNDLGLVLSGNNLTFATYERTSATCRRLGNGF